MNQTSSVRSRLFWVGWFSVAFGFVEAAVVVYLRSLYYPGGFEFPLRMMGTMHIGVELAREAATIIMLVSVGMLAGRTRWERFAWFILSFGLWDLFYYVWLKVILGWPSSILDWDILFLIPIPWIGPVLAPVLISILFLIASAVILRRESDGRGFSPPLASWILASAGIVVFLITFLRDTPATLHGMMPASYSYWLFAGGMALCSAAILAALEKTN